MTPARKIIAFPETRVRRRDYELAFLPAALEVTETPPSPIGRWIAATIIAFFCLTIAWAILGTVDIVAVAQGKIVPRGRTKIIQPFEIGVVRAIHVRDGQNVKAGDLLIELDPTISEAEVGHLKAELIASQLDVARLRAALAGNVDPRADFRPPQGATATLIGMHREYLVSQAAEYNSKVAGLDRQLMQKLAERDTISAQIHKLEATIPILEQRVQVRKTLYDSALGSKLTYLTEYQDLIGQQQDLLVQKSRYREADAAVAVLTEARLQTEAEYRRRLFGDMATAEQKAAALEQDVIKAERRTNLQLLTAPVDGTVQQLAVHTVGGVVTPAQPLLVVVPADSSLEIEATVSNRDVGFIHAGQDAEIKIDTFNFTKYGLLHGRVLSVSQDAIARDRPQDRNSDAGQGTERATSDANRQDLSYAARVSLDRSQMQVEEKLVNLGPGMAVVVEIKTGTRRIISYLLSPLAKYRQETLRER